MLNRENSSRRLTQTHHTDATRRSAADGLIAETRSSQSLESAQLTEKFFRLLLKNSVLYECLSIFGVPIFGKG
ncbi:hypothetical protein L596_013830 [Steinernema carpocapsae]|uniref:Uncharacterized protein n=1 Tax=Steinernema carpocapsae TaxID=34508 RepID=A0A4U5P1Y9_STECR|nr:hypothetical protein L596_013830 [Steinernema carpocapsae]